MFSEYIMLIANKLYNTTHFILQTNVWLKNFGLYIKPPYLYKFVPFSFSFSCQKSCNCDLRQQNSFPSFPRVKKFKHSSSTYGCQEARIDSYQEIEESTTLMWLSVFVAYSFIWLFIWLGCYLNILLWSNFITAGKHLWKLKASSPSSKAQTRKAEKRKGLI